MENQCTEFSHTSLVCQSAVMPVWQIYPSGHPENEFFYRKGRYCFGYEHPKNILFNSEKKFTVTGTEHTSLQPDRLRGDSIFDVCSVHVKKKCVANFFTSLQECHQPLEPTLVFRW